jgi:hypothetical protein
VGIIIVASTTVRVFTLIYGGVIGVARYFVEIFLLSYFLCVAIDEANQTYFRCVAIDEANQTYFLCVAKDEANQTIISAAGLLTAMQVKIPWASGDRPDTWKRV